MQIILSSHSAGRAQTKGRNEPIFFSIPFRSLTAVPIAIGINPVSKAMADKVGDWQSICVVIVIGIIVDTIGKSVSCWMITPE
jgi:hypothetical protein